MDLEQQLRSTYGEHLDGIDPSGGDVDAARRTGARMRVRRRLAAAAAAVVVVAVAAGGSLIGTGRVSFAPADEPGHWRELPAPPLSPRAYAESAWTGRELVVLGGTSEPCPPNASCAAPDEELRDGAAYVPATNTWHRIADAPVPVGPGDRLLGAGGRIVLRHWQQHGSRLFVYDPGANEWTEIPAFLADLPSAYGDDVYGFGSDRVHRGRLVAYDARRGLWNERIPRDPITPRLTHRRVTATPYGPVVTGRLVMNGSDLATGVTADLYDGTAWRRLPATRIDGNDWAWAGDRMVDLDSFEHQGMDPQQGVMLGGTLDPATGRSGPLPDSALATPEDGGSANAVGPGRWAAGWGLVYDVPAGRAWPLPDPDGAPDIGTTATWADDALLLFGGVSYGGSAGLQGTATDRAWLWTPTS